MRERAGEVVRRVQFGEGSRIQDCILSITDTKIGLRSGACLAQSRFKRPDVVLHLLYGDEQLDVLLRRRRLLGCPLIATFHLPTTRDVVKMRFEQLQKNLLGGIDAAVVVSKSQLPDFQRWLGPERVVYIPHGIDTQRFCPDGRRLHRDVVRLVIVGDHMRDLEAMHRIADECREI